MARITGASPEQMAEVRRLLKPFGGEVAYYGHGIAFNVVDNEGHGYPISFNSEQWAWVEQRLKELVRLK